MASTVTRFMNKTRHLVKMKVGHNQHYSELASIKEGGEYKLHVNVNGTYREFMVVVGSEPGCTKMIVTSDDCCDFQSVTIEEVDGKVEMVRQPRGSQPTVGGTPAGSKKSWFGWGMWATSHQTSDVA